MTTVVSIGEFSRLTHLSVKALRHYHDVGLLEPTAVDPTTGYRRYAVDQVGDAQLIRRLRELEMPIADVLAVVSATDESSRDAAIRDHLWRMERALDRTRATVASLRDLLGPGPGLLTVEHRRIDELTVLGIGEVVSRDAVGDWCGRTFERLYRAAAAHGVTPTGPAGATYDSAFFEQDSGRVLAYVPVPLGSTGAGGLRTSRLSGGDFVIGIHRGPFTEFDRTYAAVGSHVAQHDTALGDPIREVYLAGPPEETDPASFRTEVCWPVSV